MHYGAHLGVAGGAHKALERARAIGATSLQIFTQSPRMWRHPDVDPEAAARFRAARKPARVKVVVCHATYLINLGASDPEVYDKSVQALHDTMAAAEAIAADGVVFHLGSHLGRGLDAVLPQVTEAMAGRAGGGRPRVGDAARDRELGRRRRHDGRRPGRDRAGRRRARPARAASACASTPATCGRRASTSPTRGAWTRSWPRSTSASACERLTCLHVNDAAVALGSNRDRHAEVGKGVIGKELAVILGHPAVQDLAAIMETPGDDEEVPYARGIKALRRYHRAGVKRWATERAGA